MEASLRTLHYGFVGSVSETNLGQAPIIREKPIGVKRKTPQGCRGRKKARFGRKVCFADDVPFEVDKSQW